MATFDLIMDMWDWISIDLIGNEIIATLIIMVFFMVLLSTIGLPKRIVIVYLIPISISLISLGYVSWFGWLIISFAGILFGYYSYSLYE